MSKNIKIPDGKCSISNVRGSRNGRVLLKTDIFEVGDLVDVVEKYDHIVIKRSSVSSNDFRRLYKNSSSTKGVCLTLKSRYVNCICDIDVIDGDTIEINVEKE